MRIALDIESYVHSGKKGRDFTFSELIDLKRQFARGEEPKIRGGEGERTVDAQIHRRLAFPLASLLLGVLGVPLGIRPLRTGRSAGAIIAIGVMAIYWVLFTTGEIAAERGLLPAWLGLWAPNLLVLGLAVLLIRSTVRGDT
jgi:lipopolysaccharide export LptBFGC system permease protein LptF